MCCATDFGRKNNNFAYNLDGHIITCSQSEKILGVIIDTDISFKQHIYQCVDKANKMCNIILNNITDVDVCTLVDLFKCYVRPLLDYACVIYSPHHIYLIDFIENVQRRFTKRLFGLYNYSYCDRLKLCYLELLELRRVHIDLTMMYKIMYNNVCVNLDCIKLPRCVNTRGNVFKIEKEGVKLDVRNFFFALRIVDIWNNLPNDVVKCKNSHLFTKSCEI